MTDMNGEFAADDRRAMPRYPSRSSARLIRETDAMRIGISGRLTDISVTGLGVCADSRIEAGEDIRIELSNPTQRFTKVVRGVVRHSNATEEGTFQLGIELQTRLTPPEVQLLRSNRPENPDEDKPTWV